MKLTPKATKDLRRIIKKEFGKEQLAKFDDELLNDLGMTFLNLTAVVLKRRLRLKKQKN